MRARGSRHRVLLAVLVVAGLLLTACGALPSPPAPTSSAAEAPRVVVSTRSGRTVDWTVRTPSVPGEQPVRILLPRTYDQHPGTRYPVLYLLHGCCDTFASWTRSTDVLQLTEDAGVIIVMPDGGPVGFYSDWRRGPRWERYHTAELPRLLAARFRVNDRAAVAGLSMGGRGALAYAARHPGQYVAAASFSGMVDSSLSDYEPTVYLNLLLSTDVGDPDDLWGDPVEHAAVWRAHDPYDLAPRLRGVALFVSCGTGEYGPFDTKVGEYDHDETEQTLAAENVAFVARLHALGIPVQAEIGTPGTHTWPYWQRELHHAWPLLARALRIADAG
ncbi:alpha/beta hydrolase-fold protein [uncultured Amnibacterium sp.]|uniref:alpha/beta hydrolase n=1 Tax=uncultured Amnibacterium sp. TaxID=1631851 RepID=UPI0035CA9200